VLRHALVLAEYTCQSVFSKHSTSGLDASLARELDSRTPSSSSSRSRELDASIARELDASKAATAERSALRAGATCAGAVGKEEEEEDGCCAGGLVSVHIYIHIYVYVHIYIYMHVCMYMCLCIYTYI
jgi:hypothetical protein